MRNAMLFWKNKDINKTICVVASILFISVFHNNAFSQTSNWQAPTSADTYENPFNGNEKATLAGEELYAQLCAICHGNKGKGNGIAGMALKPRPSDFTKDAFLKQSDGAVFWKITEGKAPMAGYKETLTKEQRWQLVNFIKSLKK